MSAATRRKELILAETARVLEATDQDQKNQLLNVKDKGSKKLIHHAATESCETLNVVLDQYPSLEAQQQAARENSEYGLTPMRLAALDGNTECLMRLVSLFPMEMRDAIVLESFAGDEDSSVLHAAVWHPEMLKVLFANIPVTEKVLNAIKRPSENVKLDSPLTPYVSILAVAMFKGDSAKLLLDLFPEHERGGMIKGAVFMFGQTALEIAETSNPAMLPYLRKYAMLPHAGSRTNLFPSAARNAGFVQLDTDDTLTATPASPGKTRS